MEAIKYLLDNTQESAPRLQDAILFHALSRALGDSIIGVDPFHGVQENDGPIWGADVFGQAPHREPDLARAYTNPDVMAVIGGRVVTGKTAQRSIEEFTKRGEGFIIRNLNRPNSSLRHCQPKDRFEQHEHAIGGHREDEQEYLLHRDPGGSFPRRFIIVAGEIVCSTPMSFDANAPVMIPPREINAWNAENIYRSLENDMFDGLYERQRAAADLLLEGYPMAHGAIDVSGSETTDKDLVNFSIEEIHNGPPGSFGIFWAPATIYAEKIAEKLLVVQPGLNAASPSL